MNYAPTSLHARVCRIILNIMVGREGMGGVSGVGVVRNHTVTSRVGVARGVAGGPPGAERGGRRSQQDGWQDEESRLDAEVVSLLEKVSRPATG